MHLGRLVGASGGGVKGFRLASRLLEIAAIVERLSHVADDALVGSDRTPSAWVVEDEVGGQRLASLDARVETSVALARFASDYRGRAAALLGAKLDATVTIQGVEVMVAPALTIVDRPTTGRPPAAPRWP